MSKQLKDKATMWERLITKFIVIYRITTVLNDVCKKTITNIFKNSNLLSIACTNHLYLKNVIRNIYILTQNYFLREQT
jgi:hypothetical protein